MSQKCTSHFEMSQMISAFFKSIDHGHAITTHCLCGFQHVSASCDGFKVDTGAKNMLKVSPFTHPVKYDLTRQTLYAPVRTRYDILDGIRHVLSRFWHHKTSYTSEQQLRKLSDWDMPCFFWIKWCFFNTKLSFCVRKVAFWERQTHHRLPRPECCFPARFRGSSQCLDDF